MDSNPEWEKKFIKMTASISTFQKAKLFDKMME